LLSIQHILKCNTFFFLIFRTLKLCGRTVSSTATKSHKPILLVLHGIGSSEYCMFAFSKIVTWWDKIVTLASSKERISQAELLDVFRDWISFHGIVIVSPDKQVQAVLDKLIQEDQLLVALKM
uniref:FSH1 domain-containing protein n=1 Tax=Brugia pahangi TaxID=6280 RepID=A0A0N4TPL6_BRUPA